MLILDFELEIGVLGFGNFAIPNPKNSKSPISNFVTNWSFILLVLYMFQPLLTMQVCVTVIEARQLGGLNMDPVVCVQVRPQNSTRLHQTVPDSADSCQPNKYSF